MKKKLLNKFARLYGNEYDGVEVLSIKLQKQKPTFAIDGNKQHIEPHIKHCLLSNYEYVQQSTGYLGDDYYGHIARKFRLINLWVIIEYEC